MNPIQQLLRKHLSKADENPNGSASTVPRRAYKPGEQRVARSVPSRNMFHGPSARTEQCYRAFIAAARTTAARVSAASLITGMHAASRFRPRTAHRSREESSLHTRTQRRSQEGALPAIATLHTSPSPAEGRDRTSLPVQKRASPCRLSGQAEGGGRAFPTSAQVVVRTERALPCTSTQCHTRVEPRTRNRATTPGRSVCLSLLFITMRLA